MVGGQDLALFIDNDAGANCDAIVVGRDAVVPDGTYRDDRLDGLVIGERRCGLVERPGQCLFDGPVDIGRSDPVITFGPGDPRHQCDRKPGYQPDESEPPPIVGCRRYVWLDHGCFCVCWVAFVLDPAWLVEVKHRARSGAAAGAVRAPSSNVAVEVKWDIGRCIGVEQIEW